MTSPSKPLPTLPTVAARLLTLMGDPDVGVREIGDTIRLDPSLTGKLIRAVNSLQYNVGRPIADVDRAVVLLGKRTISTLALTFSLSEAVTGDKRLKKFYQQYWTESVVQGLTAELLAKTYCPTEAGQFFSAGLLQDLGRLYFLQNYGDDYVMLMEIARLENRNLIELEREAFDTTHPDLMAGMLSEWQFPQQVIFAAAAHHQFHERQPTPPSSLTLEHALQIAALMGEYFCQSHKGVIHVMLEESLSFCPEPRITAAELTDRVHERLSAIADLFNIDAACVPSAGEMLAEAMQQITLLAISLDEGASGQSVHQDLVRENSGLRQRLQEVMNRTQIDPLTGVFTREILDDRLRKQIESSAKQKSCFGLLFIDIDHFKKFNDTYGHVAGDKVLRQTAQSIGSCVRGNDFAARYGGEEFVVVVNQADVQTIGIIAERVRRDIESQSIVLNGEQVTVTASIGATVVGPVTHTQGVAELSLAAADEAMYQAKHEGRNRVVVTHVQQPESAEPLENHDGQLLSSASPS